MAAALFGAIVGGIGPGAGGGGVSEAGGAAGGAVAAGEARRRAGVRVSSAGIAAHEGDSATPEAVRALSERGVDISGHRARQVTAEMIAEADLVLTMTAAHKDAVVKLSSGAAGKVFTIREFARGAAENPEAGVGAVDRRAETVKARLEEKRRHFLAANGIRLEELRRRQRVLEQELRTVEREIKSLEQGLALAIAGEQAELERLATQRESLDLPDPFGLGIEVYRSTAAELDEELRRIAERLRKMDEDEEG